MLSLWRAYWLGLGLANGKLTEKGLQMEISLNPLLWDNNWVVWPVYQQREAVQNTLKKALQEFTVVGMYLWERESASPRTG